MASTARLTDSESVTRHMMLTDFVFETGKNISGKGRKEDRGKRKHGNYCH